MGFEFTRDVILYTFGWKQKENNFIKVTVQRLKFSQLRKNSKEERKWKNWRTIRTKGNRWSWFSFKQIETKLLSLRYALLKQYLV